MILKMRSKVVDVVNIVLFLVLLFLVGRVFLTGGGFYPKPTQPPSSDSSDWGRDRDFPPDFSEDERVVLTEQYHDYERTTQEMEDGYNRFLNLLSTMPVQGNSISVANYGGDCFAKPVVLKVLYGEKITVKNIGLDSVNIGIGKTNLDVLPGESKVVTPEFDGLKVGENLQGYSCSELGLAGYLVILNAGNR